MIRRPRQRIEEILALASGGTDLRGRAHSSQQTLDSTTELPLSITVTPLSATNLTADVEMAHLVTCLFWIVRPSFFLTATFAKLSALKFPRSCRFSW
jgi:hypothetical protein